MILKFTIYGLLDLLMGNSLDVLFIDLKVLYLSF